MTHPLIARAVSGHGSLVLQSYALRPEGPR